jgi:hypothetical protein
MLNVRSKVCCHFGRVRTSQGGRYSRQSICPLYRPANLYLLLRLYYTGTLLNKRKNLARNSKSSNVRETDSESFSPAIYFNYLPQILLWHKLSFLRKLPIHKRHFRHYIQLPVCHQCSKVRLQLKSDYMEHRPPLGPQGYIREWLYIY